MTKPAIPATSILAAISVLVLLVARSRAESNTLLILSSVVTFAFCASSAWHLLGGRATVAFIAIAAVVGWFAEQMGVTRGWFFGSYYYTDVLGARLGAVPIVIPLMWFALAYLGYIISNLILHHAPVAGVNAGQKLIGSLLAGLIVTGYDLGADPYMVYVVKAWIMKETNGDYFGETVWGFAGWVPVTLTIVLLFRLLHRRVPPTPVSPVQKHHALLPLLIYAGFMLYLVCEGHPVETRSIVVFSMGTPLLAGLGTWWHWSRTATSTEQGAA